MRINIYSSGQEENIEWSIDCTKFDPVIITVKNIKTNTTKTKEYQLEYPHAIFGHDCMDTQNINQELDKLINELK